MGWDGMGWGGWVVGVLFCFVRYGAVCGVDGCVGDVDMLHTPRTRDT
jgi:hypothetical protein